MMALGHENNPSEGVATVLERVREKLPERPNRRVQRRTPPSSKFRKPPTRAREQFRGSAVFENGQRGARKTHRREAQRTVATQSSGFTDMSQFSGGEGGGICGDSDAPVQSAAGSIFRGTIRDHTASRSVMIPILFRYSFWVFS